MYLVTTTSEKLLREHKKVRLELVFGKEGTASKTTTNSYDVLSICKDDMGQ